jgi:SAM-dependent methyltransferase
MSGTSRPAAYFDALYAANPDPWDFAGSAYEREKYDATIAILRGARFDAGLEAGCSIGVLTGRLAAVCATLFAIDISAPALAQARRRNAHLPHVAFAQHALPAQWPAEQTFDLLVFSEILYFLSAADVTRTAALARASCRPGGRILLVNHTAPIDEPCDGDMAAALFIGECGLPRLAARRAPGYRIDLLG